MAKKSRLKLAQEKTEAVIQETNKRINELGRNTATLYSSLESIQNAFDEIRNIPSDEHIEYESLKTIRLNWKQQVEKIEADYNKAVIKDAGAGVAGVGAGVAVAAMGPTVAMGIATTFGVASTGTAIASLSGAAATNAALAWLGGGALAAGGGGMAAGNAFLAMAGPVGWAIAGVATVVSGFFLIKGIIDKNRLEDIFTNVSERDTSSYNLAITELNERIVRIIKEKNMLNDALGEIRSYGTDYSSMTEDQQYALGTYVNLMRSSTQLLVNPIYGLLPKFSIDDYSEFKEKIVPCMSESFVEKVRSSETLVISLCNLLYKIDLDEKDKKLLINTFKSNKKMIKELGVTKKSFDIELMNVIDTALKFKYKSVTGEIC